MPRYPISPVCPKCGSPHYQKRGRQRVCRTCLTRYTPPPSRWERALFGTVLIISGLILCIPAGAVAYSLLAEPKAAVPVGCFGLSILPALLGLVCLGFGIKELVGRPRGAPFEDRGPAEYEEAMDEPAPVEERMVPAEQAEALVREIAERHGAKGVLQRLGNFPAKLVANARARFAQDMDDDETPLAIIDTSMLRNGKAGVLLTNKRLYSSFYRRPIPMNELHRVEVLHPSGMPPLFGPFRLYWLLTGGMREMQYRLMVGGEMVYAGGNPIRDRFWLEVLPALSDAARDLQVEQQPRTLKPPSDAIAEAVPRKITPTPAGLVIRALETNPHSAAGEPLGVEYLHDPTWEQIEARIRQLDHHAQPLVRLWTGEPEQSAALEIIGGPGAYVVRECDDAWVYYDSSRGDEEVEVQTSGEGYRCPAYYVCENLERVLNMAKRFCETGTARE